MTSAQSQEESRSRLEGMLSSIDDVFPAVEKAIEEGRIDPRRFGFRPVESDSPLEGLGLKGMEGSYGRVSLESVDNPIGLEAIIRRVGRPPMLIRNDKVVLEPLPLLPQITEAHIRRIEKYIPSVGRVEFINHAMRWGGTGFVVERRPSGVRRVVTNRHVAQLVAKRSRTGAGMFMRSPIGARYSAKLDMREEVDTTNDSQFELPIISIVYLADDTEADVALLEIQTHSGLMPEPMPMADIRGRDGESVATIGYPAFDDRNDLSAMREYFNDLYDVKRFAPGMIITSGIGTVLSHDCTTLGGNSGSCLLSLEQEAVVGLHFSGEFGVQNAAVSVETLKRLLSGSLIALSGPAVSLEGAEPRQDGDHQPDELASRNGYDPHFLGESLPVPWPKFNSMSDLARPSDGVEGREYELRYTNFGVLFSEKRRAPLVTAVNIDGKDSVRIKRGDDRWFYDLRIPRELQLGQGAYEDPEIDRGHMVRREDPNWGPNAQQANDDTFHYTNAALQHSSLNQGKTLWQGLENYILESARTEGFRASVFTGPVFRVDDPELPPSNAQVPQEFWKIVVMPAVGGGLHATGYLLSQGDLIRDLLEKRERTEAVEGFVLGPYRTFQVAITHIEEVTGLSFPGLRTADPLARTPAGQEALSDSRPAYVPIETTEDLVLNLLDEDGNGSSQEVQTLEAVAAGLAALEKGEGTKTSAPREETVTTPLLERLVAIQEEADDGDSRQTEEIAGLFQAYHAAVASMPPQEEAPGPDFASLKSEYQGLFNSCQVRVERKGEVAWHVKKLRDFQPHYEKVGQKLDLPWWFVGITHALEGSFNFKGHLHNGDPLTRRTVQVPKGRPEKWNPPNDWVSSAIDALTMKGYAGQEDWSIPRTLYRFERYNGWGYRGRGVNTPYLWSFSNHYTKGKFIKDGVYKQSAISKQCGAAVMLKALGVL